ncbi:MAG: hypothetical protein A2176_08630 [Spirochaetes bacterium RBG_13_51_14]|nr:MAG: hypothetical protein A2176_08630 [Spirochaetes bacterium RBG_13_51_14]
MSKVALIRCGTYDIEDVRRAVKRGIDLLGGTARFADRGTRVLLKPNLLVGDVPEKCVNTHPSVFRAVAEQFIAVGATVTWGDSPAIGSSTAAAKKSGILSVSEELNIGEADFRTGVEVFFEKGRQNKKFIIAKAVTDNDVVISLPKMKTHGFEKLTGAVKNQFGCVPGVRKGEYHIKLPDPDSFAQMLVDLNNLVNPMLYVMDGIWAMEGNGPRGGKPRKMNLLLFSDDPIALDATVCRLIHIDPHYVPTIIFGHQSGSGTFLESEIELLGDDIAGLKQTDFDVERAPLKAYQMKGILRFVKNRLVPKPYIIEDKCISCGVCVTMCPTVPKSVDWFKGDKTRPPAHNYQTCIRCFCCQEVCPESAILLKVPLLRRIFSGV